MKLCKLPNCKGRFLKTVSKQVILINYKIFTVQIVYFFIHPKMLSKANYSELNKLV